ncbi:MAG: TolC family protein [candidate division WOR-3 bacterium]|nr:TolC family protein [candidate division WOR-3 bacterium]
MKLRFSFFLVVSILSFSLFSQPLSLDDCISIAKQHNLSLQQFLTEIEVARAHLSEANASFYPNISLSSSYRKSGNVGSEPSGNFSTGINAQYPIYQGGSIRAGSQIAKARIKIAQANYRQKENDVVLAVKQAFFKIKQTQEQIALINTVLKRRQENLVLIKLNYSVGRENQPNVASAEANLAQSEYDLFQAQENLKLAKSTLNRLLNRNEDFEISYDDKPSDFPELDSLIREAHNQRPEIISQKINQVIVQNQKMQAISNYLPNIAVSSSYGLSGENFFEQNDNWSLGVGLSWSIFDGFSTQSKVKQANIAIKQHALKLQELVNSIESEVKQAHSDWILAKQNLEISRKSLSATQSAYQLTKLQYEQGRTSYFFLQQKENELTQAENNLLNALYNLRNAEAKLAFTVGRNY